MRGWEYMSNYYLKAKNKKTGEIKKIQQGIPANI